jgi:hypothetical protein
MVLDELEYQPPFAQVHLGDPHRQFIAEAELEAGRPEAAVDIINALHERAGLPPFDPATDGDVMEHLILTRAREFFLEGGHRLNDMLRYGIPLFTGVDNLGREYGNTTCWPLPAFERR